MSWCSEGLLFLCFLILCIFLETAHCYCPPDQYSCADGSTCIPNELKCNNIFECPDDSDEGPEAGCGYRCYSCSDCPEKAETRFRLCPYGCSKIVQEFEGRKTVSLGCSFTQLNRCDESWKGSTRVTTCMCTTNDCNIAQGISVLLSSAVTITPISFGLSLLSALFVKYLL
ncbi:LDL receptor repeat-containing protein egg-1 [Lingula anatina]|uniref:LDL receptor repeat-containing protein egg-1 n=1 Tax=Lingula anatina TaxID=7574 RepID=A0A1S3HE13_LINAN|nr:LDL receptor repeat-containing protein egg-1 [Lingula anatina]|eukprot:XP_013383309.1 LDL receptor repeat-containing protein egg-1 [Lingula anatina]